jgi:hypothetical protein
MSIGAVGSYAGMAGYASRGGTPSVTSGSVPSDSSAKSAGSAEQEFLDFAKMSPAEKIRYLYLQEHGLTEDDLEKMSPADRAKIEEKIRAEIKQAAERDTEKKTGVITDIRA